LLDDYIAHLERREQDRGLYMSDPYSKGSYKVRSQMKHLKPFYDLKPDEITTDRLVAYRDERIGAGASVVTVNRELGYGERSGEDNVLRRMQELRASGIGFDRIAATLNEERIPTRTPGKRWHGFAVNQIIKRTAV
jgi:hypothetical protein